MSSFQKLLGLELVKFAIENNLKKVQACLDLDVDVNAAGNDGVTAAQMAAARGHHEVIRLLAATGRVDWNKADVTGWTPLYEALFGGHHEVAAIILQQDNLNLGLSTYWGRTVAMAAVRGKSVACVELLAKLENVNCWNIPDQDGDIPIMDAIKMDTPDILKILLKCPRVDLNIKDRNGDSPLMKAIKEQKVGLARLLINCPRVDLSTMDGYGSSLQEIAR